MTTRRVELLAPARDLATGRVAVDAGADAVYIGGPGFGARRAAGNSPEDVAALVRYARPFGVRVYATLNTLLFDDEPDEAREVARGLIAAGVDALIVQDMGWARMGLEGVELHASTQTSNILPEDVAFLGRAGFRRVILERALSLDEIRAIRAAAPDEVELEVFVHGAICVGYSGRCFMSRAMDGTRSGNRGDCSQPCRLAWDLVDGDGRVLLKDKHLLSVRDMELGGRIGELLDAGVSSFKIEGRLKEATYVRNVVSHYRQLLDEAMAARPSLRRASVGLSTPDFTPDPSKSFTRGGSEYFLDGVRPGVASFDTPKAMGEPVGRVERTGCDRTGNRWFTLCETPPVEGWRHKVDGVVLPGDGICFFAGGELQGTNVNRVEGGRIYPNKSDGIAPGTELFRNYDHAFVRALERSRMRRRIGVAARVVATPKKIEIGFTDETGVSVSVAGEGLWEPARDATKMAATVGEQLSRSGDTIFDVREVEIDGGYHDGGGEIGGGGGLPFIPVSTLARMRREGLERLLEARTNLPPRREPAVEDRTVQAPRTDLTATENVTNRLAESFWRDHGVTEIAPAMELRLPHPGETVMRTRYCIRREIGECLCERPNLKGDLFIERGTTRWRLGFDCKNCEMVVTATADLSGSSTRPGSDGVKIRKLKRGK
jgi:putative protease